jgi:serine/threonine protein kinase
MIQIPDSVLQQSPLAEGGEGIIFEYKGMILKVYKNFINKVEKLKKIEKLVNKKLSNTNIIAPLEVAYNTRGQFIGYLMKKVDGEEFKMLSNKKYIKVHNITVKHIADMLVQVKEMIKELHSKKIYISDLNEKNFLFDKQFNVYAIDVDSWTVEDIKCEVCMEAFQDPMMKGNNFSDATDFYAFAVLAFKSLTRLHPFGGVMNPDMEITERMKRKLSVIDNSNVTIPKIVTNYHFISPKLLAEMKQIFDSNSRFLIDINLDDFDHNLKMCTGHKDYYYSKYNQCPLCNAGAKVVSDTPPVKLGVGTGANYMVLLAVDNVKQVLDYNVYITEDNIIRFVGQKDISYPYVSGERYYFSDDGEISYITTNNDITIKFFNSAQTYVFQKSYKTPIIVKDKKLYFVDLTGALIELTVEKWGNSARRIANVAFNSIFEIVDDNYFVCNIFDSQKVIEINGYQYIINDKRKVINWGIHYDKISKQWLFITEDARGKFDTYVFEVSRLGLTNVYHNDIIRYANNLGYMCFSNKLIFKAGDGFIKGYSYEKNAYKDFPCDVVTEDTKLIRTNDMKFIALTEKGIYKIG